MKVPSDKIYFTCLEGEKQISVASTERESVICIFCQIQKKKKKPVSTEINLYTFKIISSALFLE